MERRFKLSRIESLQSVPTVNFSRDGKKLQIVFEVQSTKVTRTSQDGYRDVFERAGGSAYGTGLAAKLSNGRGNTTKLTVQMNLNSKVPGTTAGSQVVK